MRTFSHVQMRALMLAMLACHKHCRVDGISRFCRKVLPS
jgi:hypothetical protein